VTKNFAFYVEHDRLQVRFVTTRTLGRHGSGQSKGGDYLNKVIRLPRKEMVNANRGALFHELGHYIHRERQELPARGLTDEDICDAMMWVPAVLRDPRNGDLRRFLGLEG
jgi:hypothetical protein